MLVSCKNGQKPQSEVNNPFATPVGCVKEYLDARQKQDVVRMIKCYSYDPKYETVLREGIEEQIIKDGDKYSPDATDSYYRTDNVKLKETYPNSAVVTVYYTLVHKNNKEDDWSDSYDLNVVKDGTNWKMEVRFGLQISSD